MLGSKLGSLDIPTDGSARLVSVRTEVDDDGFMTWTVTFRQTKAGPCKTAPPSPSKMPSADSTSTMMRSPMGSRTQSTSSFAAKGSPPTSSPPRSRSPSPKSAVTFAPVFSPLELSPSIKAQAEAMQRPEVMTPAALRSPEITSLMADRIFPLKCQAKSYDWGKHGRDSLVGRLAEAGLDDFELGPKTPYAELWMGTHPSGPSNVTLTSPWRTVTPLSEWIKLNPSLLGPKRADKFPELTRRKSMEHMSKHSLPFLFKVLSVRTALSIQAHPDKALAAQLHVRYPDQYKDDNHKPEMTVAITPFEALCSFQPAFSILENLRATPELTALVGDDAVAAFDDAASTRTASPTAEANFKLAFRELFTRLMTADPEAVKAQLTVLMKRVQSTSEMLRAPVDVLAMRIHAQYPGDIGVFCVYLLNYTTLKPGEALFLAANEPHAYISGDCAEIMATSDNVVRAGCTPKWKDVETLVSCLTYQDGAPQYVTPVVHPDEPNVARYSPPSVVDEFQLDKVQLGACGATATLPPYEGLAIMLIVSGEVAVEQRDADSGEPGAQPTAGPRHGLQMGDVRLVCPHTELRVTAQSSDCLLFVGSAKDVEGDIASALDAAWEASIA